MLLIFFRRALFNNFINVYTDLEDVHLRMEWRHGVVEAWDLGRGEIQADGFQARSQWDFARGKESFQDGRAALRACAVHSPCWRHEAAQPRVACGLELDHQHPRARLRPRLAETWRLWGDGDQEDSLTSQREQDPIQTSAYDRPIGRRHRVTPVNKKNEKCYMFTWPLKNKGAKRHSRKSAFNVWLLIAYRWLEALRII